MKILKKKKERNLRSEPERDVREGRWNLLEFEEANDGFTTPNPWKRVAAIGSYHPRKMEMKDLFMGGKWTEKLRKMCCVSVQLLSPSF